MAESPKTNRLGRTALLVQGLGLLAVGIVAAAMYWLGMESGESYAIVAVASSAAGVFIFWSLVLAIRAITGGERGNWPLAVILLTLLEIGLPCLALWAEVLYDHHHALLNFMIWLGLPVFGPFVAIGSLIAAPIALWRARKAEAAESAAGVKTWRRKTWKVWLAWYVAVMVVLGVILLPGPLFLLGASATQFYSHEENDDEPESVSWGQYVASHMPDFVRDGMGWTLDRFPDADATIAFQSRIERLGFASKARLIARLSSDVRPPFMHTNPAWHGLLSSYPESMPAIMDGIVGGQIKVSDDCTQIEVLNWVARRGSLQQLKGVLNAPKAATFKGQRIVVISNLRDNPAVRDMLPELEALVVANDLNDKELEDCFQLFADFLTPPEMTRVWTLVMKMEPQRRNAAARNAFLCVVRDNMEPMLMCLRHPDLATRRVAVGQLALEGSALRPHMFRNPKNIEHRKLTEFLYGLLDDRDESLRLSAMCVLGDIFREGTGDEARLRAMQWLGGIAKKADDVDEELAAVKAAVGKWLKENAPEK